MEGHTALGPELYDLPSLAPPDYMYLIAWSDDNHYQGAIGSFTIGSTTVGTLPNTGWEVFATGIDLDSTVATVESRSIPVANTSHPVLGKVPTVVEPMVNDPIAP